MQNVMRHRQILVLATSAMLVAGCAGDAEQPQPNGVVRITNDSQFTFLQLRFHQTPDYLAADNVLQDGAGMEPGDEALFYGAAQWYVTYYRKKSELEDVLAFTMAVPLRITSGSGQNLTIFDQSFRIEPGAYVAPMDTELPIYGEPFPAGTSTTAATR
jgi:hypothetical protein